MCKDAATSDERPRTTIWAMDEVSMLIREKSVGLLEDVIAEHLGRPSKVVSGMWEAVLIGQIDCPPGLEPMLITLRRCEMEFRKEHCGRARDGGPACGPSIKDAATSMTIDDYRHQYYYAADDTEKERLFDEVLEKFGITLGVLSEVDRLNGVASAEEPKLEEHGDQHSPNERARRQDAQKMYSELYQCGSAIARNATLMLKMQAAIDILLADMIARNSDDLSGVIRRRLECAAAIRCQVESPQDTPPDIHPDVLAIGNAISSGLGSTLER